MDKLILKLLLRFVHIFVKKGIDFERLKIIAETKVLMDRRRTPATFRQRQRKENANPLLITLIVYTFMGVAMSATIATIDSIMVSMVFMHAYLLFMMAITLITDFSSVLLDTTDNQIILPKPVTSRTLFMARVIHILVYLLQFTIALALFPVIVTFVKYGLLVGIAFLITITLTIVFALFLTYLLYGLILRFGNEQKIKDIVGYFQIFMTVFFAVGYQVLPRLIKFENIDSTFSLQWYSYLLAPVWMGSALEAIHLKQFDLFHVGMIISALCVPVITTWIMLKFLAPSFARKLAVLGNNSEVSVKSSIERKYRNKLSEKLSYFLCKSQVERAGFEKVWKITSRDKQFKIQFYPSLAYLLVMLFIFVFKNINNVAAAWEALPQTKSYLWFIYLPVFYVVSSLPLIKFYENFPAAWIYQSAPLARAGEIISGSLKALLVKFFLPVFLIFFIFSVSVWGYSVVDDFVLGFFNNLLVFYCIANLSDHYLPFSRQPDIKEQSGKIIRGLLQVIIIGILIGIHYSALFISWLPLGLIPFALACVYFLIKRIQNLSWLKLSI